MTYTIERLLDLHDLIVYLNEVDYDFGVPLSSKVSIETFAEKLIIHGNVYIVRYNNVIASCIGFYCNNTVEYTAYWPILSTKEWAQGKGFASLLIKRMIEVCKDNGMKTILCDSINPYAITLYKSMGFVEYKTEKEKSFFKYIIK